MSPTLLEFAVLLGLGVLLTAYSWALLKALRARNSPVNLAKPGIPDVAEQAKSCSTGEGERENVK